MVEALVSSHPLLLLLGQEPGDELLALLADVDEGLLVKLPSASLDILESVDVGGPGEGGQARQEDIGQHTDGPHVGVEAHRLPLDNLGGGEFGRARRDLNQLVGIQLGGQAEVNDLDIGALGGLAHHILRLDV